VVEYMRRRGLLTSLSGGDEEAHRRQREQEQELASVTDRLLGELADMVRVCCSDFAHRNGC